VHLQLYAITEQGELCWLLFHWVGLVCHVHATPYKELWSVPSGLFCQKREKEDVIFSCCLLVSAPPRTSNGPFLHFVQTPLPCFDSSRPQQEKRSGVYVVFFLESNTAASFVKCGFAGTNFPAAIFPSMVGRPIMRFETNTVDDIEIKDIMVGTEAQKLRQMLQVSVIVEMWYGANELKAHTLLLFSL
jgi:hypothetical protein